jgi:hypothetical protein
MKWYGTLREQTEQCAGCTTFWGGAEGIKMAEPIIFFFYIEFIYTLLTWYTPHTVLFVRAVFRTTSFARTCSAHPEHTKEIHPITSPMWFPSVKNIFGTYNKYILTWDTFTLVACACSFLDKHVGNAWHIFFTLVCDMFNLITILLYRSNTFYKW